MNQDQEQRLAELIEKRLNETISEVEVRELEFCLVDDKDARRLFWDLSTQHADLAMLGDSLTVEELHAASERTRNIPRWSYAVAAILVLGLFLILQNLQPRTVETLVSNEDAAWESALPTTPGSELMPGLLELKTGVATIQFHSGVTVVLEAPAKLELKTPMLGRMHAGTAVIDVPEPAIGFIMESPSGYAVDHGTQFAVRVDEYSANASFTVLSGEISVHHPKTGQEVWLKEDEVSVVTPTELKGAGKKKGGWKLHANRLRIRNEGRATSFVRNNDPELLHPDFLYLKTEDGDGEFDRQAIFNFDLKGVEISKLEKARIKFNLVQSGIGFAANLPVRNVFAVYGVKDESFEKWKNGLQWEDAPKVEDCVRLGTFEVPRSRAKGVNWFKSDLITEFMKTDTTGVVSFLLLRETTEANRKGLVHAFANDSHPEFSGPVIELIFPEDTQPQHASDK